MEEKGSEPLDYFAWFGSPETYPCPDCPESFVTQTRLKSHQEADHGVVVRNKRRKDGSMKCLDCDIRWVPGRTCLIPSLMSMRFICHFSFPKKALYNHHHRTVHQKLCTQCGKIFSHRNYQAHVTRNHPETEPTLEELTCTVCGKVAKTPSALYQHRRNYHSSRIYSCSQCDYTTKVSSSMSIHFKQKHSGPRPLSFECPVCNKNYALKSTMLDHMATHTGERKYTCEFCGKMFTASTNYYKHRKTVHPEEYSEWKKSRSASNQP